MKKQNNNEPEINESNYNVTLIQALNFYNETWVKEDYRNATIDYANSIGIDLPKSIPDTEYRNIGAICRLLSRNQYIQIPHYNYVVSRINELSKYIKKEVLPKKEETIVPEIKKETKIVFIEEIENYIDTYILSKKFDIKQVTAKYNSYSYSPTDAKKVDTFIGKQIKVFQEHLANWDEDIQESYKNLNKTDIKFLADKLTEFKSTIIKITSSTKTKPKKEKPASVQAKNIPYLKQLNTIEGKHPKSVIGKSFALIYDSNTRELIILQSIAGKFGASGMTFNNLDPIKCKKKKLRKPDEQLSELLSNEKLTKKVIQDYFNEIKTTEQEAVGRMNENKIILEVF